MDVVVTRGTRGIKRAAALTDARFEPGASLSSDVSVVFPSSVCRHVGESDGRVRAAGRPGDIRRGLRGGTVGVRRRGGRRRPAAAGETEGETQRGGGHAEDQAPASVRPHGETGAAVVGRARDHDQTNNASHLRDDELGVHVGSRLPGLGGLRAPGGRTRRRTT